MSSINVIDLKWNSFIELNCRYTDVNNLYYHMNNYKNSIFFIPGICMVVHVSNKVHPSTMSWFNIFGMIYGLDGLAIVVRINI